MRTIISLAYFSRSRLNQDPIAGSYYGWHSQFGRKIAERLPYTVECWSIDVAVKQPAFFTRGRVTYRIFPSHFFIAPGREVSPDLIRALRKEVRQRHVIIHLHDFHNWQAYAICQLLKRTPIVAHYHGATVRPLQRLTSIRKALFAPLFVAEQIAENAALHNIKHFFLANTRDAAFYRAKQLAYSFCPMAPELDVFQVLDKGNARKQLGFNQSENLILHVGGFAPVKNLELLTAAFEIIARSTPSRLILVGPTYSRTYQRQIAEEIGTRRLSDHITIVSMIPREELNDYYNAADVLVISSRPNEGGPTVVLEALAVGTPVVATPVGFIQDILPKSNGLLTIADPSPDRLASSVRTVLTKPRDRSERRPTARPWTWDEVARTAQPVYQSLFGQ